MILINSLIWLRIFSKMAVLAKNGVWLGVFLILTEVDFSGLVLLKIFMYSSLFFRQCCRINWSSNCSYDFQKIFCYFHSKTMLPYNYNYFNWNDFNLTNFLPFIYITNFSGCLTSFFGSNAWNSLPGTLCLYFRYLQLKISFWN